MSLGSAIFLCDLTGIMAEAWVDAGYDCYIVDIQHPRGVTRKGRLHKVGADVNELYRGHWWLPESAVFTFSMPDCTYLTISANRWQRARGPGCVGRGLLLADACWRLHIAYEAAYGMENPAVGRLGSSWCKPDVTFHPYEYAGYLEDIQEENTTKNTGLWTGNGFVMPESRPAPEPHRHDCHDEPPGPDRRDIRSVTPRGFARAVFEANAPHLHGPALAAALSPSVKESPDV